MAELASAQGSRVMAIVPAKAFGQAKSRLGPELGPDEREHLARLLLQRTLGLLLSHPGLDVTWVVSSDDAVLRFAAEAGAGAVREPPGAGLNPALGLAIAEASRHGASAVLVMPADLPMVGSRDVSLVLEALAPALPGVAIAPDRHRLGTNALLLRPPGIFPTRFGEGSFAAHCEAARRTGSEPVVVETVALGLDIDEPSDLSLLPAEVFSSLMLQTKELVRGQTRT